MSKVLREEIIVWLFGRSSPGSKKSMCKDPEVRTPLVLRTGISEIHEEMKL